VTLTLSLAYLSVLTHQRNREHQAAVLRSQALALQSIIEPIPAPLPPSRAELAAAERANAVEVVKDRWNHEVENAVRWFQRKDWDEVREGVEGNVARMWTGIFGQSEAGVEQAREKLEPLTTKAKLEAEKAAYDAKAKAQKTAKTTASKAEGAVKETAGEAAAESKSMFSWAWAKGQDKAQDVADSVKPKADGKILTPLSPVEKALHQRYEKPTSSNKTVAEILSERYKPMDQQDNTVLRGV
jgi:MICOS complex subunit MIC12